MEKPFRILLYYKFVPVPDPLQVRDEQEAICREHGLLGRILVASEGINGTVSGTQEAVQAYMNWMGHHPLFAGIEFKVDEHTEHAFHKLHVRVRNEIVHFGVEGIRPWENAGDYIEPDEFRHILENPDSDTVILDARSEYETRIGRFRGAVHLDIDHFRDLPSHLSSLEVLRDKRIITYCTGGIKCEKVSAWLIKNGFKDVRQLHGGIIRYAQEAGGAHFEGECYVFDERVVVPVNQVNPVAASQCCFCGTPSSHMINCANASCNVQVVICPACADAMMGCCSDACKKSPQRRTWDGRGHYLRGINSKNYADQVP